jgi:hypothetical protein
MMRRERRHEILWELVDSMFTKVEYWNEDPVLTNLTEDEYNYLINIISKFAKSRNITNHVNII